MKEIGGMKMVESITAKELEKIYKDDGVNIIDVREMMKLQSKKFLDPYIYQ